MSDQKYKCLIVDDEQPARALLASYVEKVPHLELVGTCKNSMEAMSKMNETDVDVLLLDIQMPDLTGVDLLKSLSKKPVTIFTTAYQEYALVGYELDVVDYLLKPFPLDRFLSAINKAIDLIRLRQAGTVYTPASITEEYMVIKADHKLHKVKIGSILYIEGLREYVTYHLEGKRKIIALESLKSIESLLQKQGFIRVHKSFIVNKHHVQHLEGNRVKVGEEMIPVGASYRELAHKLML
ncbi:DNA-binding response regulator [Reichenbachiella sp. 5M10]|uniref:LytR/AlgR family response regulator transcription factor n=1 Tax=Reichenbachiella sp. 5M10 TaxID=1889772 RepID=UPI000C156234|nr:LytTR family DNA-binding domain-containing protein [Reichenbachiella sp. 5M10]PIB37269.1 DNA-binding response regulator [Reichenbachiella sp. 5M10]